MPFRNGTIPANYLHWSDEEINFIKENFHKLTNQQLADSLHRRLTNVRTKCYELGLKRMELEYWTDEQIQFLRDNYKTIGDTELAEIFSAKWKKAKGWSKKHLEKKRRYLKLKRTAEEKESLRQREVERGTYVAGNRKMWETRGAAKEGEVRYWRLSTGRMFPHVKTNGRFKHWNVWAWEKHFGVIPKDLNVVFKDNNPWNLDISNLELVTNKELAKRSSMISSKGLSDNYVIGMMSHKEPEIREELKRNPQIIELKRKQIILNRIINEQTINQTA